MLLSYATLLLAVVAFIVAIGSLGMTFYTLQPDQQIFGAIIMEIF